VALSWQEHAQAPVTFAAFDRHLWHAAKTADLQVWPKDLAPFIKQGPQ
jgi:hypothetical protein